MTEEPADTGAEPERPHHSSDGNLQTADRPARPRHGKVRSVLALAVIGLAVFAIGLSIYPRRPEPAATVPPLVTIQFNALAEGNNNFYVTGPIEYIVDQVRPDLAKVTIEVFFDAKTYLPGAQISTTLQLAGQHMAACSPQCSVASGAAGGVGPGGSLGTSLSAAEAQAGPYLGKATAVFLVKASSFGEITNGATAEATFPELSIEPLAGYPGEESLSIQYQTIPSASSYDWSADPPQSLDTSGAGWQEPIVNGITYSRIAVGTNLAAQQRDSDFTLIAGILFGIGGGALVAAIQEALDD